MSNETEVSPRANQKEKTVNFVATVTVNGKKDTIRKEQASYARLVSVQTSLASVVVGLASMGAGRVADAVDGTQGENPGGGERLSLGYQVDHGKGGSSGAVLDYVGLDMSQVEKIVGMFKAALDVSQ